MRSFISYCKKRGRYIKCFMWTTSFSLEEIESRFDLLWMTLRAGWCTSGKISKEKFQHQLWYEEGWSGSSKCDRGAPGTSAVQGVVLYLFFDASFTLESPGKTPRAFNFCREGRYGQKVVPRVGSIAYLPCQYYDTRIVYFFGLLSPYIHTSGKENWSSGVHVIRYLSRPIKCGIWFCNICLKEEFDMVGYTHTGFEGHNYKRD